MTSDDIGREVRRMGEQARAASHALTKLSTAEKNAILLAMAEALVAREPEILAANALDLTAATEAGLSAAMQDRLRLDSARIAAMANGIREVAALHRHRRLHVAQVQPVAQRPAHAHVLQRGSVLEDGDAC